MIMLTLKFKHYIFTYFFHFYIHAFGYGYFLYFRRKIFIISRGVAPRSGKNYMKSMVAAVVRGAGRSHANTAKNVRKWWCCKLLFLHETCENKKFLSILEKGKQTREICRYSILNFELGACDSWWVCDWVSPFSVCNFDKQSFFAFIVLTVEL